MFKFTHLMTFVFMTLFLNSAWAGKCIVRINGCPNPRVNLTKELGIGSKANTNSKTCMAKAEELKDLCNVKGPLTAYYQNNYGKIIQKVKLMTRSVILRHPEPARAVERICPRGGCTSGFLCASGKISPTTSCGQNDATECYCSRSVWTVY